MIKQISPEIARIHAHVCGDGCVYIKKLKISKRKLLNHKRRNLFEKIWVIEYTNTVPLLRNEFTDDVRKAFERKAYDYAKYHRIVLTHCKWIVNFLEIDKKNSYNWQINEAILSNKKVWSPWLRAFFDDEATISEKQKMIRVKSMNLQGLKQILRILNELNFNPKITGRNSDGSWYLNLYRVDLKNYQRLIGFLHPLKKVKLNRILNGPAAI